MKQIRLLAALCLISLGSLQAQKKEVETLIVGTYTPATELNNPETKSAYIVLFDAENGSLQLIDSLHAGYNASFIAADRKKKHFYAVNELGGKEPKGKIKAFNYSMPWTQAKEMGECSTLGNDPCHVSLSRKHNIVTAANYSSGNLVSIKTDKGGALECIHTVNNQHVGRGGSEKQTAPRAHQVVEAPFGQYLYACDLGTDAIYVYKMNLRPFAVEPIHTIKTEPGAGPRHMLFHPNKKYAYVVNELNGTVECFLVNKKSGQLNRFQTIATTPDSLKSQAGSADIHITSDGKYLYTSNRGPFNEIVCFEVNPKTGELKINGHYPSGGLGPRNFRISNNNQYMLVANQRSNNIVVYGIDPTNGALTPTGEKLELHAPVCITEL